MSNQYTLKKENKSEIGIKGKLKDFPAKPPLIFDLEGKEVSVYGGSCHKPKVENIDMYVSLDKNPPVYHWEKPWNPKEGKTHIRFPIPNMSLPENVQDFKDCVSFIKDSINNGQKVHVGCIGGKGRTGMILSALIQTSMGDRLVDEIGNKTSAIDYVRENYSNEAVETVPQILFLYYNMGIDLPKNSQKEVSKYLKFFEKEVGISLDNIIDQGVNFDDICKILKEVEDLMFSQRKFISNKDLKISVPEKSNTSTNHFSANNMAV